MKTFFLYVMALFYFVAGINHFIDPDFYLRMIPPYIPEHRLMILLSGVAEVLLATLLIPKKSRSFAAWGIVLMLLVFYTVHIYMVQARYTVFSDIPEWLIWSRLPLQIVFIYWASLYTKTRKKV